MSPPMPPYSSGSAIPSSPVSTHRSHSLAAGSPLRPCSAMYARSTRLAMSVQICRMASRFSLMGCSLRAGSVTGRVGVAADGEFGAQRGAASGGHLEDDVGLNVACVVGGVTTESHHEGGASDPVTGVNRVQHRQLASYDPGVGSEVVGDAAVCDPLKGDRVEVHVLLSLGLGVGRGVVAREQVPGRNRHQNHGLVCDSEGYLGEHAALGELVPTTRRHPARGGRGVAHRAVSAPKRNITLVMLAIGSSASSTQWKTVVMKWPVPSRVVRSGEISTTSS